MAKGYLVKRKTGQWIRVGDVTVHVEEIRKGQVYLRVDAEGQVVRRGEQIDANSAPDLGSQAEQGN